MDATQTALESDRQIASDVIPLATTPAHAASAGIPWYLWCAALAVTSAYVGGYWDISWHRSIGRDSLWSAPHLAIYACGILAGIVAAYLILGTTFNRASPLCDASVRIWGLRGPVVCLSPTTDARRTGLDQAALLIADGDADQVLVVLVEQATAGDTAVALLVSEGDPS